MTSFAHGSIIFDMTDDVDANSTDMRGITDEVVATVQEARDVVPEAQQTRAEKVTMMKGAMAAILEARQTKGVIGIQLNAAGQSGGLKDERGVVVLRRTTTIPGDRGREIFGRAVQDKAESVRVGVALSQEGYHLIPLPTVVPGEVDSSGRSQKWDAAIHRGTIHGSFRDSTSNGHVQGLSENYVRDMRGGKDYTSDRWLGIPNDDSGQVTEFRFQEAGKAEADIIAEALQASIMEAQKSQVRQIESDTETADIGSAMMTALRSDA